LLSLSAVSLVACGDDVDNTGPTSSSGSSSAVTGTGGNGGAGLVGGSASGGGGSGAEGGGSPGCTPAEGTLLAIRKIYWGDTLPNGMKSTSAWRQYGFNLDGLVSNETSTDVCVPAARGNPSYVHPDGDNGIDNAWGKNLLPIFLAITTDFSDNANLGIQTGQFTLMLELLGVRPGDDNAPAPARLFSGLPIGISPAFDGQDCWPVSSESLASPPDLMSAKSTFPDAAIAGNVWSSNGSSDVALVVGVPGFSFTLPIRQVRFSAVLDPDHQGATLGLLGGVMDREEFIEVVTDLFGTLDPSLCEGATADSIKNQIRQAADILADGTQDPAKECDGISIGLGFDLAAMGFGPVEDPPPPGLDPCP